MGLAHILEAVGLRHRKGDRHGIDPGLGGAGRAFGIGHQDHNPQAGQARYAAYVYWITIAGICFLGATKPF